jgi:hypothetical protein
MTEFQDINPSQQTPPKSSGSALAHDETVSDPIPSSASTPLDKAPVKSFPVSLSGGMNVISRSVRPAGPVIGNGPSLHSWASIQSSRFSLSYWGDQALDTKTLNEVDLILRANVLNTKLFDGKLQANLNTSRWWFPNSHLSTAQFLGTDVSYERSGNQLLVKYLYSLPEKSFRNGQQVQLKIDHPVTVKLGNQELTIDPALQTSYVAHFLGDKQTGFSQVSPSMSIEHKFKSYFSLIVGVTFQIPLRPDREKILYGFTGLTFNTKGK